MDEGPKQEHKVLRVPHLNVYDDAPKELESNLNSLMRDGWMLNGVLEEQSNHILIFYREVWPPPSEEEKEARELRELEGKTRADMLEKTMVKNLELMERLEKREEGR